MKTFGLVGEKLSHSFSKIFFDNKFENEKITDACYQLFECKEVDSLVNFIANPSNISGLNVTIPYKQKIIPFLDQLDESAQKVGAVNVIKFVNAPNSRIKIGYNTDYLAFKNSLLNWIDWIEESGDISALVLGTGGAAKAVWAALEELRIPFKKVSRTSGDYVYEDIVDNSEILKNNKLVVNTTPLGMLPNINTLPNLPYSEVTENHYLYDLVYNPEMTSLLKKGKKYGAKIKNGLEMLHLQAEYSWNIWNS